MDFSNWQTMLFSAQGRIRRSQYWLWGVILAVSFGIIIQIVGIVTGSSTMMSSGHFPVPIMVAELILMPVYGWMSICLSAKRWHDRDKSGWMAALQWIPIVNIVGFFWQFIECGILDGTPGPNKYGPSPKGLNAPETKF